ncbi:hypothetical protein ACFOWZ_29965 [Lentzea rhizosphaerae]|uniref:Extracellular repeat, HAF family n=1 Tax=Lentzea rhizosphaerae TaxID=2041025 RepID=A0ABV8C1G5_9PSEU
MAASGVAPVVARAQPDAAAGRFTMIELEVPDGTTSSQASGVNDVGMVVGTVQSANGYQQAAMWDRDGRFATLKVPSGFSSSAIDITDTGVITGMAWNEVVQHSVRWNRYGVMTVLRPLVQDGGTGVGPVNHHGVVAGFARAADGLSDAVRWDQHGRPTDLGTLPGGQSSVANSINDHGVVAGIATTPDGFGRAVTWDRDGGITELPTLGGSTGLGQWINDHGVVAGGASTAGADEMHPARWDRTGRVTALQLPSYGHFGIAYAVNNSNTAVGVTDGRAARWDNNGRVQLLQGGMGGIAFRINDRGVAIGRTDETSSHAVSWDRNGMMTDLGMLPGDEWSTVRTINDRGDIAGYSIGSTTRAVLWQARTG